MSGLAGYARGGQGGGVSKSQKARGNVEKAKGGDKTPSSLPADAEEVLVTPEGAPSVAAQKARHGSLMPPAGTPGGPTPFGDGPEETTPGESPTPETKSLAAHARSGIVLKQVSPKLDMKPDQPRVASDIPGAGPQGVPPAEADELAAFARRGNLDMKPQAVSAQTGLSSHGPAVRASLARMGGQVRLAPGQFGVWAHPMDPTEKPLRSPSSQVSRNPDKPGSMPEPATPVY